MSSEQPESLKAKALKTVDLVNYQDGSVVSRVILKQKTGNVSLFAFDTGQELSEHTAPFDALVNVLEGEVEVTISGAPIRVTAGEMVIMPANQPHALKAISRFKMMLTMIRS
jgi:quercetin dioxygenase-like cupin family protein